MLQANFAKPELGLNLEIAGLQLREVDLPDDFDDEIENTQEQMQEATYERQRLVRWPMDMWMIWRRCHIIYRNI